MFQGLKSVDMWWNAFIDSHNICSQSRSKSRSSLFLLPPDEAQYKSVGTLFIYLGLVSRWGYTVQSTWSCILPTYSKIIQTILRPPTASVTVVCILKALTEARQSSERKRISFSNLYQHKQHARNETISRQMGSRCSA